MSQTMKAEEAMSTKILITHLSGAKQNQIEQIALDGASEVVMGRDPGANVVIDGQDDLVGRRHAAIRISRDAAGNVRFTLADLDSRNGTFLDGARIVGEVELMPGDTIELARGGPRLGFDLQPLPANLAPRTRVMKAMPAGATRFGDATAQATTHAHAPATTPTMQPPAAAGEAPKQGVGHETVQRLLMSERKSQSRLLMYGMAAVLVAAAVGGAALYHNSQMSQKLLNQNLASVNNQVQSVVNQPKTFSPADIASKYGNATVVVYLGWKLIDTRTGTPVYQKLIYDEHNNPIPVYVKLPGGKTVPWLTTDASSRAGNNELFGESGRGSGFIVAGNGTIVTNKHVAAGWMVSASDMIDPQNGIVITLNDDGRPAIDAHGQPVVDPLDQDGYNDLKAWIPGTGGIIFDGDAPVPIAEDSFQGVNDTLQVLLPGQQSRTQATLVSYSDAADVAIIKIDAISSLPAIPLAAGNNVHAGDPVTVIGYPGVTPDTIFTRYVVENGVAAQDEQALPTMTVTTGNIAAIGKPVTAAGGGTEQGAMGEVYQLTDNSTGHGNSGGPVFDNRGNVIGIFTYGGGDNAGATVTYAVPIHFAQELLTPSTVN